MSDVTADDLQKSLDRLEEYSAGDNPAARKDVLLAKVQESDLEKSERDELFALLGGAPVETETVATVTDELTKSLTESGEGLQEALDVSAYLRDQHEALVKSLTAVGEVIEKSSNRQMEIGLLQSGAIVHMGNLVKSMCERLGVIEAQPVRGPKSRGLTTDQALAKSFAGQEGGEQLSKSEIADALDAMHRESCDAGKGGMAKSGEDINLSISQFEQQSKLSPTMFGEVKSFIAGQKTAN